MLDNCVYVAFNAHEGNVVTALVFYRQKTSAGIFVLFISIVYLKPPASLHFFIIIFSVKGKKSITFRYRV